MGHMFWDQVVQWLFLIVQVGCATVVCRAMSRLLVSCFFAATLEASLTVLGENHDRSIKQATGDQGVPSITNLPP